MMFAIDQILPDRIKLFVSLGFILLIILRCGGISVLFRTLLRSAGLKFNRGILGKADDEIFHTQTFALLNGVKVDNVRDAKLLSKGLLTGEISKKQFYFASLFGAIGKKKRSRYETWLIVLTGLGILSFSFAMLGDLPKNGYANYRMDKLSVQISESNVLVNNEFFNPGTVMSESDCIKIIKTHPHDIYRSACEYISLDDKVKKAELIDAINSWNYMRNMSFIVFLSIIFFFTAFTIGSINHRALSNHLFQFRR
ncbi:hypothetical protein PJX95_17315 [Serratia rubidaea]|uniref:hypothetical protein n=1 Tax=Serratia rubidaea TaxID=61652 RepID=UPI002349F54D|nr:hypothetical protein [Serratia rubidaea]MDC6119812.1 hypothetical protein [Serratia rubidaea]